MSLWNKISHIIEFWISVKCLKQNIMHEESLSIGIEKYVLTLAIYASKTSVAVSSRFCKELTSVFQSKSTIFWLCAFNLYELCNFVSSRARSCCFFLRIFLRRCFSCKYKTNVNSAAVCNSKLSLQRKKRSIQPWSEIIPFLSQRLTWNSEKNELK